MQGKSHDQHSLTSRYSGWQFLPATLSHCGQPLIKTPTPVTPPHHSTTPKVFPRSQPVQNLKPFHHQNVSADMKIYKGSCKKKAKRRPRLGSRDGTSFLFQASRWNTRPSGMAGESSRVQEDGTAQHCTAPLTFPGAHQLPCELFHLLCRRPSSPCSLPTCARLAPFHC